MTEGIDHLRAVQTGRLQSLETVPSRDDIPTSIPPRLHQAGPVSRLRMVVDPKVVEDPLLAETEALVAINQLDELAQSASSVLASLDVEDVNIDKILMEISKIAQADQTESFLLSKTSIDFNRRMRERIYNQVQQLNEEIEDLEKEITDLQDEIENHNGWQKMGEAITSAFGGGKTKELGLTNAELMKRRGDLDATRAGLKEREKFLEHGYQIMQEAIGNLKDSISRLKKSINQVQAVWQAASATLDKI